MGFVAYPSTLNKARGKLDGRAGARPSSLPHDLFLTCYVVGVCNLDTHIQLGSVIILAQHTAHTAPNAV